MVNPIIVTKRLSVGYKGQIRMENIRTHTLDEEPWGISDSKLFGLSLAELSGLDWSRYRIHHYFQMFNFFV